MRRLLFALVLLLPATVEAQQVILSQYPAGQKTMSSSLPVVIASDQGTLAISAASLPLPSGAATETTLSGILTTEQSALTSLQLIDNLPLAEDGVHVSGESGVLILGVRNDAGP